MPFSSGSRDTAPYEGLLEQLASWGGLERIEQRLGVRLSEDKLIACGVYACAWLASPTRVIKVTTDQSDAETGLVVKALVEQQGYGDVLARIGGVWRVAGGGLYVIEAEALDPVRTRSGGRGEWTYPEVLINELRSGGNNPPYGPDDVARVVATVVEDIVADGGEVQSDQEASLRADVEVVAGKFNRLRSLAVLGDYSLGVRSNVLLTSDAHAGNWGFERGHYGDLTKLKLLDFGESYSSVRPTVPALNPRRRAPRRAARRANADPHRDLAVRAQAEGAWKEVESKLRVGRYIPTAAGDVVYATVFLLDADGGTEVNLRPAKPGYGGDAWVRTSGQGVVNLYHLPDRIAPGPKSGSISRTAEALLKESVRVLIDSSRQLERARSTFIHEFTHVLDLRRGKRPGGVWIRSGALYASGKREAYFLTPEEFNAYFQEGADTYDQMLHLLYPDSSDLPSAILAVLTHLEQVRSGRSRLGVHTFWAEGFLNALQTKPQEWKRFQKRLAGFLAMRLEGLKGYARPAGPQERPSRRRARAGVQ